MEPSGTYKESRAEKIRSARECCYQLQNISPRSTHTNSPLYSNEIPQAKDTEERAVKKSTLVRWFFSAFLFLLFFLMDYIPISYKNISVEQVKKIISKNVVIEQLEMKTADYMDEKILPVFQKLEN